MPTYPERLEHNLKKQIDSLEKLYESDRKLIETSDGSESNTLIYEEYVSEQEDLIRELDGLDRELDNIYGYLSEHKDITDTISQAQRNHIRNLTSEIDGKIQALQEYEAKAKSVIDGHLNVKRSELAVTRKNVRVLQNHYSPAGIASAEATSIFDTTN